MSDQSDWPAHLRDDAPFLVCSVCSRRTWPGTMMDAMATLGSPCESPQPDGSKCAGEFTELHAPIQP